MNYVNDNQQTLFSSPTFLAFLTGLYVAAFYITTNVTILNASSVLLIAIALIVPITVIVAGTALILKFWNFQKYVEAISIFICISYFLIVMRYPILEVGLIKGYFLSLEGTDSLAAKLSYAIPALLVATLFAYIFRNTRIILTVALTVMTASTVILNLGIITKNFTAESAATNAETDQSISQVSLDIRPNIYLVISDGFSSLAYMDEHGIDISEFESYLRRKDFELYKETFSNYQSTINAMTSMLNMDHHFYTISLKVHEASWYGREVMGGRNRFMNILKANAYETQYIHYGPYLLVQGCSADLCYPKISSIESGTMVLDKILPHLIKKPGLSRHEHMEVVKGEVLGLIERSKGLDMPHFQYIHMYRPSHTNINTAEVCDEKVEFQKYVERLSDAKLYVEDLIENIVARDPSAVIVLSGDHGPFIKNECHWSADLQTLSDYRDRAGVLTAIRWPEGYKNQYDAQIKTTANILRYVLASLMDDDKELLKSRVPDDVYTQGADKFQRIVKDGEVQLPPESFSEREMEEKFVELQVR